MHPTPLAWIMLPLLAGFAAWRTGWFVGLLAVTAVMQGASLIDLGLGEGRVGLSPYLVGGAIAGLSLLRIAWRDGLELTARNVWSEPLARGWFAYFAIAAVGALVLPRMFAGLEVYSLLGLGGFDVPKEPLAFGLSHYAQIVNLAVHAVVLAFLIATHRRGEWQVRHLMAGLAIALALVVAVGAYERVALLAQWPSLNWLLINNPGYKLYDFDHLGGVARVYSPFSEPSYASAYLAAAWLALLVHATFAPRWRTATVAALGVVGLALANTLGATGLTAVVLGALVLLACATTVVLQRRDRFPGLGRRVLFGWFAAVLALGAVTALQRMPDRFPHVHAAVQDKLGSDSVRNRGRSNDHALELVRRTHGMGVGIGSNRASSFFASLASNTGLPGMLAFGLALFLLARRYATPALDDAQWLAGGALAGGLIAVGAGIPDLNIPFFWMFVFAATMLAPARRHRLDAAP